MARLVTTAQEPITPAKDGLPPCWVVACLDCSFAHDAHGLMAEDAIATVARTHAPDHRLIARAVDYAHPTYGPDRNEPHPLYR